MPASVFIETTIPSYYFETRKDRRTADWRAQTRLRWDRYAAAYELVTSEFVIAEYLRAPAGKSEQASRFFDRLEDIISACIKSRVMPAEERGDTANLATASMHAVDFVLTWNCRHLANANKSRHIRSINTRLRAAAGALGAAPALIARCLSGVVSYAMSNSVKPAPATPTSKGTSWIVPGFFNIPCG